jgi:hypothetical protein
MRRKIFFTSPTKKIIFRLILENKIEYGKKKIIGKYALGTFFFIFRYEVKV